MSFDQSICWTFSCCESDLEALYWRYTYRDLTGRLKIRIGEFSTNHVQQAHSLAKIVGSIMGGEEKKPKERILTDINQINRMLAGQV